MRDGVAHLIGKGQGQFGVRRCERRVTRLDVVTRLADDLEIADLSNELKMQPPPANVSSEERPQDGFELQLYFTFD